jgi:hypothetical protein
MVAIGIPETSTRGLGTVGIACPPWEHKTVAPTCKIGPGIYITVNPPILISTAGPINVMVAPCPLLM